MTTRRLHPTVHSIAAIRQIRAEAEYRLSRIPNVIGTMIGRKITTDRVQRALCLTVFVRRKAPLEAVAKADRIPPSLVIGRERLLLDVVQMGPLRPQKAAFPPSGPLLTYDGVENGTLSCLCRSGVGVLGLTCAHALKGPDHDPATPTSVAMWSPSARGYLDVGESVFALMGPGSGVPGEYGFADVAIFMTQHAELIQRAAASIPVTAGRAVPGIRVWSDSVANGRLQGQILGIEKSVGRLLADVVIRADLPGTFRGDSGLLWKNAAGQPIALHAYGEDLGPGNGSRLTAAMLATRAEARLGIQLLRDST